MGKLDSLTLLTDNIATQYAFGLKTLHMLKANLKLRIFFVLVLLFALFFYQRSWGLNLFLFQLVSIGSLVFLHRKTVFKSSKKYLVAIAVAMSFVAFLHHSAIAFIMSWLSLMVVGTAFAHEKIFSIHFLTSSSFASLVIGPYRASVDWFQQINSSRFATQRLKKVSIYILPLVLIAVFAAIYSGANPRFGGYTASFFDAFERFISWVFSSLNWEFIGWLLLGFILVGSILYSYVPKLFVDVDQSDKGILMRKRISVWYSFKNLGLKSERNAGVFLLAALNVLLVVLLISEAQEVWFGFKWEGGFLKEFVHEGIYLLILSILISMGVVLYFFRKNQNFYTSSPWLKRLTYVWIALNIVLVISVSIRNLYYIEYFALAYKRIGVFFFLAATLVGLYSIFIKVSKTKNATYLMRVNSLSVYVLLCFMAVFNWDVLIAQYNFKQFGKSMVELNYMAQLSNKALPYLVHSPDYIAQQQVDQQRLLNLSSSSFYDSYMNSATYQETIENKKQRFLTQWEQKDWLEWNYAESKAYNLLTDGADE